MQLGAQLVVPVIALVRLVRAVDARGPVLGERSRDRHQVARGLPDRLFLGMAEKPPCAARPVGHEAVGVHDDHGKRNPAGHGALAP